MTEPRPEYNTVRYTSECDINSDPMTIVSAVGEMNFEGNVIPHSWFEHLRRENGRPYPAALMLLSEIVYWHRPIIEKDEANGRPRPLRKKFAADKWQRSYTSLSEQFGFSKRQVADALKWLRGRGIITMEFRNLLTKTGLHLSNVLYIELQPEALRAITFTHVTPPTKISNPSYEKKEPIPYKGGGTYPQTPSEIPSDIVVVAHEDNPDGDLPFSEAEERTIDFLVTSWTIPEQQAGGFVRRLGSEACHLAMRTLNAQLQSGYDPDGPAGGVLYAMLDKATPRMVRGWQEEEGRRVSAAEEATDD